MTEAEMLADVIRFSFVVAFGLPMAGLAIWGVAAAIGAVLSWTDRRYVRRLGD